LLQDVVIQYRFYDLSDFEIVGLCFHFGVKAQTKTAGSYPMFDIFNIH